MWDIRRDGLPPTPRVPPLSHRKPHLHSPIDRWQQGCRRIRCKCPSSMHGRASVCNRRGMQRPSQRTDRIRHRLGTGIAQRIPRAGWHPSQCELELQGYRQGRQSSGRREARTSLRSVCTRLGLAVPRRTLRWKMRCFARGRSTRSTLSFRSIGPELRSRDRDQLEGCSQGGCRTRQLELDKAHGPRQELRLRTR